MGEKIKQCGNCKYSIESRDKIGRKTFHCRLLSQHLKKDNLKMVKLTDYCWQYEEAQD